jgi:ABC-type uncharacterized transport system substrate-binding protein
VDRRTFLSGLTLGMLRAAVAAEAQQAGTAYRVGFLSLQSAAPYENALKDGLRALGYVEGKDFVLDVVSAQGRIDLLPDSAAELVKLNVNVIVAGGTPAILAVKRATTTIPIVMASSGDAVGTGLVTSLSRPGGNVTGLSWLSTELSTKYIEFLREIVPRLSRVAVLFDSANPPDLSALRAIEGTGKRLNVEILSLDAATPRELEKAFTAVSRSRADAFIALPSARNFFNRQIIADLAREKSVPGISGLTEFTRAGGLISYGVNLIDMYRRAAYFVDKLLKGAKPADLPVEQPTKFELAINLKTAKALGLTVPPALLVRADEVIQ